MIFGKNIKKLTSEFLINLRITKNSLDKLSDIKFLPNAIIASESSAPILKSMDRSKVHHINLNYHLEKNSFLNFIYQEKSSNSLPTTVFPVLKKIIEPDVYKNINIENPININRIKNIDLPTNMEKEMFDPLGNVFKKEAAMSLVRIKRRKMRIHKYKKRLRKMKTLILKIRLKKRQKKEAAFQDELQQILNKKLNYSAEKYVEDTLAKLDWQPPVTKARGILAPQWVIDEELKRKKFYSSIKKRAEECAEKMRKKLF